MSLLYPVRISQDRRWTVTLIAVAPCITVVTRMEVSKRPTTIEKLLSGCLRAGRASARCHRACFGEEVPLRVAITNDKLLPLTWVSFEDEIKGRLASWKAPAPRYQTGVMAKYARLVSSASVGAVTG